MKSTKGRILLAESDSIFGDLLEAHLRAEGYRTRRVRDGRLALDALANDEVEAIVAGLELPGVDGLELAACVALLPMRPPFVLTAEGPGLQSQSPKTLGVDALILRPCRLEMIVEAIEGARRRRAPRPSAAPRAVPA